MRLLLFLYGLFDENEEFLSKPLYQKRFCVTIYCGI